MAEGWGERQLPHDIFREQGLPSRRVGNERLDVLVQELLGARQAAPDLRPRRIVTRSWACDITSRSVSGRPGRTIRARSDFAPCIAVGCVSTSHSNPRP
jgi:hypothetical protein